MITKTLKVSIALVAVASFSFASAQEKVETKVVNSAQMFKYLDVNADKKITLEEYKTQTMKDPSKEALAKKRFALMDTDKNGIVDKSEFKVAFEAPKTPQQRKNKITKG